jgi:hypothetical protein
MKQCNAENCRYNQFGGGYCKIHQYLRTDKKQAKIKPYSDKRAKINREQYAPAAKEFIKLHPMCSINSPACTGKTQCVHHSKGKKTIHELLDASAWKSSCYACNTWVESNDGIAREQGHKLNTFN